MDEEGDDEFVSKTRRKREMHALQDLGEELVGLSEARLQELELSERLLAAVLEAKRISKFGALRRQMQFIGRLMRDADGEAIAAKLEVWKGNSREQTAHLHRLERWRERLIDDDEAIGALAQVYPGCDLQRVRTLVRNARREQARDAPPASFRELFQALKEIIPAPDPATDAADAKEDNDRASTSP